MFFTLKEIVKWFGMTAFEIWVNLVSVFVFSIIAVLKHEKVIQASWWYIFIPLLTCDGLNAYFCAIVFIRQHMDKEYRAAALRAMSSIVCLVCMFLFKMLICKKLNEDSSVSYSEAFASIFVLLQVIMVRACQSN